MPEAVERIRFVVFILFVPFGRFITDPAVSAMLEPVDPADLKLITLPGANMVPDAPEED